MSNGAGESTLNPITTSSGQHDFQLEKIGYY